MEANKYLLFHGVGYDILEEILVHILRPPFSVQYPITDGELVQVLQQSDHAARLRCTFMSSRSMTFPDIV